VQLASTGRLKRLFSHYLGKQDNSNSANQLRLEVN
jgi:hypothetical protein